MLYTNATCEDDKLTVLFWPTQSLVVQQICIFLEEN